MTLAGKDHLVSSTVDFGKVERRAQVVQAMDVYLLANSFTKKNKRILVFALILLLQRRSVKLLLGNKPTQGGQTYNSHVCRFPRANPPLEGFVWGWFFKHLVWAFSFAGLMRPCGQRVVFVDVELYHCVP
jgi:hypothetical protein